MKSLLVAALFIVASSLTPAKAQWVSIGPITAVEPGGSSAATCVYFFATTPANTTFTLDYNALGGPLFNLLMATLTNIWHIKPQGTVLVNAVPAPSCGGTGVNFFYVPQ